MAHHLPRDGVDFGQAFNLISPKLHTQQVLALVGRENFQHVASHPELVSGEIDVVSLILNAHQAAQHLVAPDFLPLAQRHGQLGILLGVAQAVNAGHRRHDDDVPTLKKGRRGGVPQLVELLVDGGVLFNKGVGRGNIGLRLIVVIVGDEIFHRIVRKKLAEFAAELGCQRLVVGKHQGGPAHLFDDVCHGVGLSGAGHTQQRLRTVSAQHPLRQRLNGLWLVS